MYPARFGYRAPRSLAEALAALTEHGADAKVLAGGQSLVPMIKLRFASPSVLVDINGLTDLAYHHRQPDGSLRVGALCRHADLERSRVLLDEFPTMAAAAPLVADPIVRNRGTLVGSLCHADPQGDWAAVLVALKGEIVAAGPRGERTVPASEFVLGPFQNALAPDEIAVEARVPAPVGTPYGSYLKLERRVGDFATAAVAVAVELTGDRITRAGIALTGVGPSTIAATDAARSLLGESLEPAVIDRAAALSAGAAHPRTDHRGSAEYKRHLVGTFVRRALSGYRVAVAA
ncbi:MAG: FAD binding domain-containing protein [Pseudonocardia sp.]|jgi:aerobic carbon-monoxide dehydrogenase medium subunit